MRCRNWKLAAVMILIGAVLCTSASAERDKKKAKRSSKAKAAKTAKAEEVERKVKESEVPKAALKALKKLARGAEITEFAEEIEYGHTFYEGSWKGRSGANVDVLVTKTGDLVEIEEKVDISKVPAAVLKAAQKAAGKSAQLVCEKKTMILYEVKFSKGDSRHELLLTPDGRRVEEEVEKGKSEDDDEGDGDADGDDEDEKDGDKHKMKANGNDDDDDEDDDDDDEDDD